MKKYTVEITKLDENSNYFDRKQSLSIVFAYEDLQRFFSPGATQTWPEHSTEAAKGEREMVMQTAY